MENLIGQLALGKGLWLGLFFPESVNTPLRSWLPDDAHVTVAYFGKGVDSTAFRRIVETTAELWVDRILKGRGIQAELTGFGWFWQKTPLPVLLVNSGDLTMFRAQLIEKYLAAGVPFDTTYGFIPHMTMKPDTEATYGDSPLITGKRTKFEFPQLHLVAGEERVSL